MYKDYLVIKKMRRKDDNKKLHSKIEDLETKLHETAELSFNRLNNIIREIILKYKVFPQMLLMKPQKMSQSW